MTSNSAPATARLRRPALLLAALLLVVLSVSFAPSADASPPCTTNYIGGTDGLWNAAGDWSANAIPTTSDVACIPSGLGTIRVAANAVVGLVNAQSAVDVAGGVTLLISDVNAGDISTFNGLGVEGDIAGSGSLVKLVSGTLSGSGAIDHPFFAADGAVEPGGHGTVGKLHFTSSVSIGSTATLALDLASDSSFDQFTAGGAADVFVEGPIVMNALPGYQPAVGTSWTIMSGAFGAVIDGTVSPSQFGKLAISGGMGIVLNSALPITQPPVTTPITTTPIATPTVPTIRKAAPLVTQPSPAPAPIHSAQKVLLGCTTRKLVLNDVLVSGGKVVLDGAADTTLAGQAVKILFDGRQPVATAKVGASGAFHTSAPLPAKKLIGLDSTRYTAVIGTQRSPDLKLVRRLVLSAPKASDGNVTLSGQVVAPLAAPVAAVTITQQVDCAATTVVKTLKPGGDGRFHVTLPAPAGASGAIYRLSTKVRKTVHGTRASSTFSLPLPAVFGQ